MFKGFNFIYFSINIVYKKFIGNGRVNIKLKMLFLIGFKLNKVFC